MNARNAFRAGELRVVAYMMVALVATAGCNSASTSLEDFEFIEGTRNVQMVRNAFSISPDGRHMVFLTCDCPWHARASGGCYGISSKDLVSGEVIVHEMRGEYTSEASDHISLSFDIAFHYAFSDDGWWDGRFVFDSFPWIEVKPGRAALGALDGSPSERGRRSSDRRDREFVLELEGRYWQSGNMERDYSPRASIWDNASRGIISVPADTNLSDPPIYYTGLPAWGSVYRTGVDGTNRVFRNRKSVFHLDRIEMIKVSPDQKYLAVIYENKVGLPIPTPGGATELTLIELSGKRRTMRWVQDFFGACTFSPDSEFLYVAAGDHETRGVYRLSLSGIFDRLGK